jgi:hypothetical protein
LASVLIFAGEFSVSFSLPYCLSPSLCLSLSSHSKHTVQQIYDHLFQSASGPRAQYGLSYSLFIELLDHVAQNCIYTTKNVHGPYSRVRTLFHVMNSSRGRMKLARDSSETIINPLTALDSTEPTSFHKSSTNGASKTPPSSSVTNTHGGQHIQRSQSLMTPPSSNQTKRKSTLGMTAISNTKSTPKRAASIGPSTVSATLSPRGHLNGRSTSTVSSASPSSIKKLTPRGNLKSER